MGGGTSWSSIEKDRIALVLEEGRSPKKKNRRKRGTKSADNREQNYLCRAMQNQRLRRGDGEKKGGKGGWGAVEMGGVGLANSSLFSRGDKKKR